MFKIICIFAKWIDGGHDPLTRGMSIAPSTKFMIDRTLKIDYMAKKLTVEEFKSKLYKAHGDRYCYDLINESNFINMRSKIPIICKEHGLFMQIARTHLVGHGCPMCGKKTQGGGMRFKKRSLIFGVGINDVDEPISTHGKKNISYDVWKSMLQRCYVVSNNQNYIAYNNCFVCNEWLRYSNFKMWFENPKNGYKKGYHIDKDILKKGNKMYSPATCCFVPAEINTMLVDQKTRRGDCPRGVSYHNGKYRSIIRIEQQYILLGTFSNKLEAFNAYKIAKERHIQDVASKHYILGNISDRVYNALMNYTIEIND